MTSPSRPNATRRGRRDAVQLLVGMIVVFGLIASALLVFTDNLQYVRVGLVSALWAAAIGALAMTRYRRELVVEGSKIRDLQTVYQLQLEREVSARREYELGVETRVRKDIQVDLDELVGLRTELAELRKNLQLLFDGNLLVERPALRADSTRLHELQYQNGYSNGHRTQRYGAEGHPPQPIFPGDNPANPVFAGPYDEPVTAETSAVEQFLTAFPTPQTPGAGRWNGVRSDRAEALMTETAEWSAGLANWPEREESQQTQPQPWCADQDWDEDSDDDSEDVEDEDGSHTTGLTVAQIMANLRSEGTETAAGTRSHRRGYDY